MFRGIVLAIGACFAWGLLYVIPQFLPGFSSMEIVLGRYFVLGATSFFIFLKMRDGGDSFRYPPSFWIKALYFSFISSFGFYMMLFLAVRYCSPAISALILGMNPITIGIYGNLQQKGSSFKTLIFPSFLILAGLLMINISHLQETTHSSSHFLGVLSSFLALSSCTWYVVSNARFLKDHPAMNPTHWCTMIGMGAPVWGILLGIGLYFFFPEQLHSEKYQTLNEELIRFLIGIAILGIACSWLADFLWNHASFCLPVFLIGQLTILESVFAIFFVFLLDQKLPPLLEAAGIALQLFAIFLGIRQVMKKEKTPSI